MTAELESYFSGQGPLLASRGATADLDSKGMNEVALTQVAPIVGLPESLQKSRSAKIHPNVCPLPFTNRPHTLHARINISWPLSDLGILRKLAVFISIPSESSNSDFEGERASR